MVEKQLEVLRKFPSHPKRSTYEKELVEEQEKLIDDAVEGLQKLDIAASRGP